MIAGLLLCTSGCGPSEETPLPDVKPINAPQQPQRQPDQPVIEQTQVFSQGEVESLIELIYTSTAIDATHNGNHFARNPDQLSRAVAKQVRETILTRPSAATWRVSVGPGNPKDPSAMSCAGQAELVVRIISGSSASSVAVIVVTHQAAGRVMYDPAGSVEAGFDAEHFRTDTGPCTSGKAPKLAGSSRIGDWT